MKVGPGWDTRAGRIAGGAAILLFALSLGLCMMPEEAPAPRVEVQRFGAHLNVEATVATGPFLTAIGRVVRQRRAELGDGAGLRTASFDFRQAPERPFAVLDYDAPALLRLGPDSSDAAVEAARDVSERAPTGPRLLGPECTKAELRRTKLCRLVLE